MDVGALLLGLGFVSPVVAVVCAGFFYVLHCRACPDPKERVSGVAYIVSLLTCACIAYFIGLQYGIAWD